MKKKKPNLVMTFILTMLGVVGIGVLGLLAYGASTGRIGGAKEKTAQNGLADPGDGDDIYRGREEISADDPAALGMQYATGEEDAYDTAGADISADEEASYKSIYSGVYARFGDDLDDPEYLAANKIYVLPSRDGNESSVSLTFGGDILFDDEYAVTSKLIQNGGEIAAGIDPSLISVMKASDITMVNNEFPYSYGGTPTPDKTYTFRADPPTVRWLSDMGVNAVGIANNHAFDFGEQAFADTLTTLEEAGMPYCGGGRDISEASAPLYFVVDDYKIGIIAATQIERIDNPDTRGATDSRSGVFRCLNPDRLLAKISETKPKCDFLIVFIHWGTESTSEVDWLQLDQAPKIASAGADIIIGAHPHVLQGITKSKGIPVFYSLGNFWFSSKDIDTGLAQLTLSQSEAGKPYLSSLRFIPCRQVGCKTRPATAEEAVNIIGSMRAMSPGISIDGDGYITY